MSLTEQFWVLHTTLNLLWSPSQSKEFWTDSPEIWYYLHFALKHDFVDLYWNEHFIERPFTEVYFKTYKFFVEKNRNSRTKEVYVYVAILPDVKEVSKSKKTVTLIVVRYC